jgi:hypothetical protein
LVQNLLFILDETELTQQVAMSPLLIVKFSTLAGNAIATLWLEIEIKKAVPHWRGVQKILRRDLAAARNYPGCGGSRLPRGSSKP